MKTGGDRCILTNPYAIKTPINPIYSKISARLSPHRPINRPIRGASHTLIVALSKYSVAIALTL